MARRTRISPPNSVPLFFAGANLRTGKIGIFPLAHVVDVDYNDFDPRTNEDRKERYLLEYIGSVESNLYKGNSVLYQVRRTALLDKSF